MFVCQIMNGLLDYDSVMFRHLVQRICIGTAVYEVANNVHNISVPLKLMVQSIFRHSFCKDIQQVSG